uniref:KAT8 regulatory NSL complex subunit 2 n=1 Tax=Kalanchoe fedtschenkoi TaxID=63787 RepID=A0A7N0T7Z9_KALFE
MVSNADAGSDAMLSDSDLLTAEEMIRRRHRRILQLSRVYRDHYWSLMADLRKRYRDYLWTFGGSPFDADLNRQGKTDALESNRCAHSNCTKKAMPMTRFCHSHILSDSNQVLYKGCAHLTFKSGSAAPAVCAKPILRSATPSFCTYHLQRVEKSVARSLKKAGLSTNDSNRMAPMVHIIGAEFVQEILRKRRALKETTVNADKAEQDAK